MLVASADFDFVFKRRVQAAKVTARNLLFFTVCAALLFCHVSSSSILSASHPISAVKTNFSFVIDMIVRYSDFIADSKLSAPQAFHEARETQSPSHITPRISHVTNREFC
jgi:hypothetical protein